MKQAAIRDLETRTLDTSIETIRERVDKLGVTEPVIQKYGLGENQILVELPGVDDPARVEEIIQSTAKLEIHAVAGGPYETRPGCAAGERRGDSCRIRCWCSGSASAGAPEQVWLLKRVSEVEGTDFRDAQPSTDQNGRPNITFNADDRGGRPLLQVHRGALGYERDAGLDGDCAGQQGSRGCGHPVGDSRPRRDYGRLHASSRRTICRLMLRTGALPASISFLETRTVGPSWARRRSTRA